jgi:hypothetical protein
MAYTTPELVSVGAAQTFVLGAGPKSEPVNHAVDAEDSYVQDPRGDELAW